MCTANVSFSVSNNPIIQISLDISISLSIKVSIFISILLALFLIKKIHWLQNLKKKIHFDSANVIRASSTFESVPLIVVKDTIYPPPDFCVFSK